jgi:hypothetical protein
MEKTQIMTNTGLVILPIDRYKNLVSFLDYAQAHAEALLDEVITFKEVLENSGDNEIKVIKSTLD